MFYFFQLRKKFTSVLASDFCFQGNRRARRIGRSVFYKPNESLKGEKIMPKVTIAKSVGMGGKNNPDDVIVVKKD